MISRGSRGAALPRHACLAVVVLSVAGCFAQPSPGPPTLEEAQLYLAEIVALAQRGDFEALCEQAGDGNCERKLEDAGADRVPAAPPTVTGARVLPTTSSGGQTSLGGLVLVLCGVDRLGSPYRSEMLVFRDHDMHLRAINPIYWTNIGVAGSGDPIAVPAPPATC